MSVSAGLYIQMEDNAPPAVVVIRALVAAGWSLNDQGAIRILPLGDDDSFNWTAHSPPAEQEVWQILEHKQNAKELIGVTLLLDDTGVGGEFLVDTSGLVTFSATINRRLHTQWSDVTWYLERILPPLSQVAKISSWEWTESR